MGVRLFRRPVCGARLHRGVDEKSGVIVFASGDPIGPLFEQIGGDTVQLGVRSGLGGAAEVGRGGAQHLRLDGPEGVGVHDLPFHSRPPRDHATVPEAPLS